MAKERENRDKTRLTLINRLRNRDDQRSWETFVDLYWRRVYGVCMAAGLTESEAEDAAQETMIGVAKDIEKYDSSLGRFTPWLLGRAKWRITEQLRKRKHQLKRERSMTKTRTGTLERIPDEASLNREEVLESEWKEYLFKIAVDKIKHQVKPAHFQIFDLLVLKKMTVEEVTALTGVIRDTIYTIKHRVLQLLQEQIKTLEEVSP